MRPVLGLQLSLSDFVVGVGGTTSRYILSEQLPLLTVRSSVRESEGLFGSSPVCVGTSRLALRPTKQKGLVL